MKISEYVESRIVECGDRMKQTDEKCLSGRIIACEDDKTDCGSGKFESKRSEKNAFYEFNHVLGRIEIHAFPNNRLPAEADAFADDENNTRADGGDA